MAENACDELARLYAEWVEEIATAAALLRTRTPGEDLSGYRLRQLEQAEAKATSLVFRYRAAAGRLNDHGLAGFGS